MEEEAVNLTEEIRTRKHTMRLCLGSDSDDKHGGNIVVDQTPTPTRLIRNCEEVGLFEDLKHVNPFEETFRQAVQDAKTSIMLPEGAPFESATKILSEDTLHTPHIFPSTYFSAEATETAKTPRKERQADSEEVGNKRKWMPANWKPTTKSQKLVTIQPKISTPQIIQPAIILPPTVIVKCLNPSPLVGSIPAISVPVTSVAQDTSSIVKKRLRILCREQKAKKNNMKAEKEICVKKEPIEEKDVRSSTAQSKKSKGNNEAVKRYRARLKTYQDYLKTNNEQLQDENAQLKQQNEKLRNLLRKHNISIPDELLPQEVRK